MNAGGPHGHKDSVADVDGGKMDGFVAEQEHAKNTCLDRFNPACANVGVLHDAMGYHDAREIPNYWAYASDFVLQDHMFESVSSWSVPAHLYLVSGWSAACRGAFNPMSCHSDLRTPDFEHPDFEPDYAWTDITYLLHRAGVSWAYYVAPGTQPDCADSQISCVPEQQNPGTPEIWNPLPDFTTVRQDRQLGNVQPLQRFYTAARTGTLPAVSWITPNGKDSEHPPALVSADGTGEKALRKQTESTSSANDGGFVWSPDGTQIAFGHRNSDKAEDGLYVVNTDGSGLRLLASKLWDTPTWSADGSKIAFSKTRGGSPDIYLANANGSGERPLFTASANRQQPNWQPSPTR